MQAVEVTLRRADHMDLSEIERSYARKTGHSAAMAGHHAALYRDFLKVIALSPSKRLVPDERIDAFWHEHIASGQSYETQMRAIFGRPIKHDPSFYGTDEWRKAWAETRELFVTHCGYDIGYSNGKSSPPAYCGGGM